MYIFITTEDHIRKGSTVKWPNRAKDRDEGIKGQTQQQQQNTCENGSGHIKRIAHTEREIKIDANIKDKQRDEKHMDHRYDT